MGQAAKRVQVQCSDCGKQYSKTCHGVYEWTGRCKSCAAKRRRHAKVLLICMKCCAVEPFSKRLLRHASTFCATCHGRQNAKRFFQRRGIILPCLECGWPCRMRPQALRQWLGRCKPCSQRHLLDILGEEERQRRAGRLNDREIPEEERQRRAKDLRARLQAQGGILGGDAFRFKKGNRPWTWKGGITPENKRIRGSAEGLHWRRAVKERDDFTCQICGVRGGRLHSDHIKPFATHPESRFDLDNGRTLCVECHRAHHKKVGIPRLKK